MFLDVFIGNVSDANLYKINLFLHLILCLIAISCYELSVTNLDHISFSIVWLLKLPFPDNKIVSYVIF